MRKPIDQLKRPHLKGEFACSTCQSVFTHRASLNRHRQKCISGHICLICNIEIGHTDALKHHMNISHGLNRVYTCVCCAFTFESRKTLSEHFGQLESTGTVDKSKVIAMAGQTPGVPLQKKHQSGPGTKRRKSLSPSSSSSSSNTSSNSPTPVETPREITPKLEVSEIITQEPMDEIQQLTSEIIGNMLDNGWYSDEQLVLPETWMKMVGDAQKMAQVGLQKTARVG
ncbi:unnamed protein product [Caenorhabditis brenneri]